MSVFLLQGKAGGMEQRHKDLLISKTVFLVQNMEMPLLYDHMIQTKLISRDDRERMEVNQLLPLLLCLIL